MAPPTREYVSHGRIVRHGMAWRYLTAAFLSLLDGPSGSQCKNFRVQAPLDMSGSGCRSRKAKHWVFGVQCDLATPNRYAKIAHLGALYVACGVTVSMDKTPTRHVLGHAAIATLLTYKPTHVS